MCGDLFIRQAAALEQRPQPAPLTLPKRYVDDILCYCLAAVRGSLLCN